MLAGHIKYRHTLKGLLNDDVSCFDGKCSVQHELNCFVSVHFAKCLPAFYELQSILPTLDIFCTIFFFFFDIFIMRNERFRFTE